jgi:DNA primase
MNNGKFTYLRGKEFPIGTSKIGKYIGAKGFTIKRMFNEDILLKLKQGDSLYLIEGELDTMIAAQAGYNAIGFPGVNGIPFERLKQLNISQYKIYVAFDADEAGDKAAQEICDELKIKVIRKRPINGKDLSEVYHG